MDTPALIHARAAPSSSLLMAAPLRLLVNPRFHGLAFPVADFAADRNIRAGNVPDDIQRSSVRSPAGTKCLRISALVRSAGMAGLCCAAWAWGVRRLSADMRHPLSSFPLLS